MRNEGNVWFNMMMGALKNPSLSKSIYVLNQKNGTLKKKSEPFLCKFNHKTSTELCSSLRQWSAIIRRIIWSFVET